MIAQAGFGLGVFSIPPVLGNESFPSWIRPQVYEGNSLQVLPRYCVVPSTMTKFAIPWSNEGCMLSPSPHIRFSNSVFSPQACGIVVGTGTLTSVIVLQVFTPMLEALTLAGLIGVYAIVSLSGFVFTFIFVKETKDLLLK